MSREKANLVKQNTSYILLCLVLTASSGRFGLVVRTEGQVRLALGSGSNVCLQHGHRPHPARMTQHHSIISEHASTHYFLPRSFCFCHYIYFKIDLHFFVYSANWKVLKLSLNCTVATVPSKNEVCWENCRWHPLTHLIAIQLSSANPSECECKCSRHVSLVHVHQLTT